MKNYITVIGLEVHAELKTKTKAFCSCSTEFGAEPNTHVCPVCLGMPGALPVLNKRVVEFAIRAGLALNCDIQKFNKMDRKNYFYPDLAKNYQISQWDEPICLGGHIDIRVNGEKKRIGITRIHMEEDAGKLVHSGLTISTSDSSAVDYNRAGVPLIEIVSEPDMRSAAEARAYMEQLKAILEYTDVCDCKMQEGSLRCDANISVMPEGATEFGTRAEIKNLNSFRALERAIEYEVERQIEIVEDGGHVVQETRTWDDANGVTLSMRSKEEAHDYRYFPEPDLVPINLDQAWIDEIKATLPELPSARKERLLAEDVPEDNADIIVASKKVADYFDEGTKATKNLKALSNWLIGDVAGYLNAEGIEIDDPEFKITPDHLGELVNLIDKGVLSSKLAKQVFAEMLKENEAPEALVKKLGLEQVSDAGELGKLVDEVIAANPQSIADFKAGKKKALGFLVGQIMKATHGKANPGMVNKMLMEKLQ
ncbi:aspartyl/glutamyl-tRNA(Asn/Gln) amidotransferase subunit B [Succiniclasticum ruminis]|jgi:aspartyl-tRNA(Asn)/glutamyl-tRNA(Gln) amidotransferase subunit B|uniref:Aspartyl/glutamyl-tRNA(Asn/Gln) amidotransferase subunit B n=1 Tax=Succiniclasticum ruminis TaxID=40841 RepID=A0A1G6KD41_9FIRM|nr:Asp-tRNA(Asn)/Glu-tRNA(Gln) amidotransferase subunit GatB [Succiniclasticum ruminis]SDC28920.1 aspartyl/glutamyl-tRNA(Asn/Gln) amidotransferase subunit B [Succiniclasticum ruminis]